MKKLAISFSAFICAVLMLSATAFAAEKITAYDGIKSSYYVDKSASFGKEIDITDSYETLGVQAKAKTDELIPIYYTDTESAEKLQNMLAEISRGKSLESFLIPKNQYFAFAYDGNKAVGYCILSDKLEMQEVGKLNKFNNPALRLNSKATKALSGIDLNNASAKYCIISGFAVGTLIYDSNSEFFIPSVECLETANVLTVGSVYRVSDLYTISAQMPEKAPNSLDENGNPYTGAEYYSNISANKPSHIEAVPVMFLSASVIFAVAAGFQIRKVKDKHSK